jgi:Flp pilus assembly protein TadG
VISTIIVVPIFLFSVLLVVQFGLAYHARRILAAGAHDGAAAAARVGSGPGEGAAVARNLIAQSGSPLLTSYSTSGAIVGDRVVVTAQGRTISLVPFAPALAIRATGSAPLEKFRPEGG